ncbi:MAG: hypothetical protein QM734_13155 [Cyclobacteriaceae bacterium]
MPSKEITTKIDISTDLFISNLRKKIQSSKEDAWGLDYFQWKNIELKNDKLIIEKSMKPLSKDMGKIESNIVYGTDKTILKSKIYIDTFFQDFIKYFLGIGIGLNGFLYLILLDFNFFALGGLVFFELIIFLFIPIRQEESLNNLVDYYNKIIKAIATE